MLAHNFSYRNDFLLVPMQHAFTSRLDVLKIRGPQMRHSLQLSRIQGATVPTKLTKLGFLRAGVRVGRYRNGVGGR